MSTASAVIDQAWDYTEHAEVYLARPDYPAGFFREVGDTLPIADLPGGIDIVEIGAGTGKFTKSCLEHCPFDIKSYRAVEPNDAMRERGIRHTEGFKTEWTAGTGEHPGVPSASADWLIFAQCFDTMDRLATLRAAHDLLRPEGWLTVLWNRRQWERDDLESEIEEVIADVLGQYKRGVRREDQTEILLKDGLFDSLRSVKVPFEIEMSRNRYLDVWRSVRTLAAQAGPDRFKDLIDRIGETLDRRHVTSITVRYICESWNIKRVG